MYVSCNRDKDMFNMMEPAKKHNFISKRKRKRALNRKRTHT